MLNIDGTQGGGQVLRTSLALSAVTGTPFRIQGIRGARHKPGLLRQHLCAVRAASEVCGGSVEGDALGSMELVFRPGTPRAGTYDFEVGSAGSAGLVLQTIWPILWTAKGSSTVTIGGGTHNSAAPPAEFLQRSFMPALCSMGVDTRLTVEAYGFMPAGGGRYRMQVEGGSPLVPIERLQLGETDVSVDVLLANVPGNVGQRERVTSTKTLGVPLSCARVHSVESRGPGNAVIVTVQGTHATQVHWALGARNVRAEHVATQAARSALAARHVPVCEHLADQLLIPMALAGGGHFRTVTPSAHTRVNATVIQTFLNRTIDFTDGGTSWDVRVTG